MAIKRPQPKKRLPSDERKAAIIAAAADFLSEYGFNYTTRQLAEHLGITQPLLYKYFASKEELIDAVYDSVYRSQTLVDWETTFSDRSRPLRDRLIEYLKAYTREIHDERWIRIFMFGSLTGADIHRRFIGYLNTEVFPRIAEEIRWERGLPTPESAEELELQLETVWGFHAGFFYLGVRKWIYRLPIPKDVDAVIERRVDALLEGAPTAFARAHLSFVAQMRAGTADPKTEPSPKRRTKAARAA